MEALVDVLVPFYLSAATGEGIDRLAEAVATRLDRRSVIVELRLPIADGRTAAAARAVSVVRDERVEGDDELVLELKLLESALGNLCRTAHAALDVRVLRPADEPLIRLEETT